MKVRKISLVTKLLVVMIAVLFISEGILGFVSVSQSKKAIREAIQQRMLDISNAAAGSLDGDILENLTADDIETPEYKKLYDVLAVFRDKVDLEYIYSVCDNGDGTYGFTVDVDIEAPADFGDPVEYTDALGSAFKGTAAADQEPYEDEWGLHYSAYSPVYNSSKKIVGIVGVDFSASWFEEQISKQTGSMILISVILLILGVLIILFLTFRFRFAFIQLHKMLKELGDGSGDLTRKLDITSGDEFEEIAKDVNGFMDQIRLIVSSVKDNVTGSVSASDELTTAADQARDTVNLLSDSIHSVSAGAVEQARDSAEAAENVSEIRSRLSTMGNSVDQAEQFTEDMNRNSREVSEQFEQLISAIQESMEQLKKVTGEISTVGDSVDSVIEAANVIDSIANQTNLLSLNASIEAARAGEAGKGFAVVAEEIGKLAVQSNESAASIKKIMDNLKDETSEAVNLVSNLDSVMKEQEKTSIVSRDSLKTLFGEIESTKNIFDEIRVDTKGIQDACENLTGSIDNLSSVSEKNAASAQETADSVSEILTVTDSVAKRAENIKEYSDNLGDMVREYKV